jgi:PAS domain S-box-containing protein
MPPPRSLARWPKLEDVATVVLALVLFLGIFALRMSDPNIAGGEGLLYIVPVGLLALRFGLRGGLAGGIAGFVLAVTWALYDHRVVLNGLGYLNRGVAFLTLGALFGSVFDYRRKLERENSLYYDASLDLLATADSTGRFIRVNAAWEHTLGHSAEMLCSRPSIDFVHPDDRSATLAERDVLTGGSRDTVRFRNRCRTADGRYLWLEWSAHASPSEDVVHWVARDITTQRAAEQLLAGNSKKLQGMIEERTHELDDAHAETLHVLGVAAEYRDDETFQHTERVGDVAAEIAVGLGFSAHRTRLLREAAPLHDIGKIAIPDRILLKHGMLSGQERNVMETHAPLGGYLLSGTESPVLQLAAVVAASHHEWWDGTGYPAGLVGERIPLVGRIVAVADVFDALSHDRPYKPAWPAGRAIAEIRRGAGTQFDPQVVAAFLTCHERDAAAPSIANQRRQVHGNGVAPRRWSAPATRPDPQPVAHS